MYKVYIEDYVLLFASPSEVTPAGEIFTPDQNETVSVTKLLQKLQITKHLNIISDDIESIFEDFCSGLPLIEAGGGVARNAAEDVLMIFRNGRWDLPKGKLEKGERIEACAVREVCEECGLSGLDLGRFIMHTHHCYRIKERWVLKRTSWYQMRYTGTELPHPQTVEGITIAEWVPQAQIPERLLNTYHTIRDVFRAAGYDFA